MKGGFGADVDASSEPARSVCHPIILSLYSIMITDTASNHQSLYMDNAYHWASGILYRVADNDDPRETAPTLPIHACMICTLNFGLSLLLSFSSLTCLVL